MDRLAFLAFILFIFTTLFDFRDGRWHLLDRLVADFPSIWHGFILALAIVLCLLTLFAIVSLIVITVTSFIKHKQTDKRDSLVGQASQIVEMRNVKEILDKFFVDIEGSDNDDKPKAD